MGKPLSITTFNHTIQTWFTHTGVDPRTCVSHSLRRRGTTAAAKAKVRMHVIKCTTAEKSDVMYLYVVYALEESLSVSTTVLGM